MNKFFLRTYQVAVSFLQALVILFEKIADYMLDKIKDPKAGGRYASVIRTLIIMLILWTGYLAHMAGARRTYGYTVFFIVVMFGALIYWMPRERRPEYCAGSLQKIWALLCLLQFLSEIIVQKQNGFIEVWMLLSFGVMYRAWGRMEKPEELWDDFARAAEVLYLFVVFSCVFVEPWWKKQGYSYTGIWKNPNLFSMTIVFFIVIMVYRIFQIFYKKGVYWKSVVYLGGIIFGVRIIFLTQCRTSVLTLFALSIWSVLFLLESSKKRKGISWIELLLVVAAVVAGGLILMFKGGSLFAKKSTAITLDEMTSGRLSIWKVYLMQMNWIGHGDSALINGTPAYAHNVFLKAIHTYGILAGVILLLLLIVILYKAVRYWKNEEKNEKAFLIIGLFLVYIVSTMVESVDDLPLVWQIWTAFYFVMGFLMLRNGKKDRGNG